MEKRLNQVLGGTRLDAQGEKLSKKFIEKFCSSCEGRKIPLHQHHDMSRQTAGYIENLRVEKDPKNDGEWSIVGDVYSEIGAIDELIGGFSISGTETIHRPDEFNLMLYIPYPTYNDDKFVENLLATDEIHLSKWIKKGVEPASCALFVAVFAIVITPVWDHVYKRKIAPLVDRFMDEEWPKIRAKNLGLEHAQLIDYEGYEIEIRLIGVSGKERECYSPEVIQEAVKVAVDEVESDFSESNPITRLVLFYDSGSCNYKLHRTEYYTGNSVHHA
tara:strand:- start:95 stop:916 length:822 start_codon:yes stop_codon:yes gene_type:complete